MSTPQSALTSPAAVLLDGIVAAVADRPHMTPERKQSRVAEVWAVIDSFRATDPAQIMLAGQAVLFSEVIADGARDVLSGMAATMKLRAQSNLTGMSRALHQNLSVFLDLREKAEAVVEETVTPAVAPRQPRATASKTAAAETPPVAAAAPAVSAPEPDVSAAAPDVSGAAPAVSGAAPVVSGSAAPVSGAMPQTMPAAMAQVQTQNHTQTPGQPVAAPEQSGGASSVAAATDQGSWVDEPYTTWIIETPAAAVARERAEQAALAAEALPRTAEVHHFDQAAADSRPARRRPAAPGTEAALANAMIDAVVAERAAMAAGRAAIPT